jgi:biotin carboxyl carrier protein
MSGPVAYRVTVGERSFDVTIEPEAAGLVATCDGERSPVEWSGRDDHTATIRLGEAAFEALLAQDGGAWWVALAGYQAEVLVEEARALQLAATLPRPAQQGRRLDVRAPMPGRVAALRVASGASVERGAVLVILEAMKMENELRAPQAGRVAAVGVAEGDTVEHGSVLMVLEPPAREPTAGPPAESEAPTGARESK